MSRLDTRSFFPSRYIPLLALLLCTSPLGCGGPEGEQPVPDSGDPDMGMQTDLGEECDAGDANSDTVVRNSGWTKWLDGKNNLREISIEAGAVWLGGMQLVFPGGVDIVARPWAAKYSTAGMKLWQGHFPSKPDDDNRYRLDLVSALCVAPDGTPTLGGHFDDSTDFGAGEVAHTSGQDLFVLSLTP